MAVTRIHTIHTGTYGAIAYICNPDKTADRKYVVSNLCVSTPCGASEQFRNIRQSVGTGRSRSECQHIIQSFAPGEVTPERALLIGQELCKALNEMNASNSTLEELESAAHRAFAEFMVMSTPQIELSARIHKMEEQIPAIEKHHEFVAYHKKYTSLEGKAKTKYKSDFCYELDEYHKAYKKLIELFPDAHIPKLSKLKTELEKVQTDYAEQSAERKALKKEADRLSRLAQQKRDSQKTLARYMQNEQAAKRKKSQLE